jgi:hypothetical protein
MAVIVRGLQETLRTAMQSEGGAAELVLYTKEWYSAESTKIISSMTN